MSPSVEDNSTLSPTGTTEQSPQDQVQLNHHATPDPSPPTSEVRGKRVPPRRASVDRDAQELVISSLRTQVQDLVSQVTALNNKLVKSYDRVSDLEDDLHVTSSTLRSSSVKISELELERSQHLSALNTGLLVEKAHVTSELTRLMEKATEEAARRGQAESARSDIEKDLDDVSAALFDQANTMVAEARWGRAQSDRKAEEAERALREAEDAVRVMQQELQALQGEKEAAERRMEGMSAAMGKGKWIERVSSLPANAHHLLTSHVSYQEFLSLLSHLRALRATSPQPPSISSLLGLPFIARLQLEDTYVSICPAVFHFADAFAVTQQSAWTLPLPSTGCQDVRSLLLSRPGNSRSNPLRRRLS
jgi:Rab guanine nucleotide exchange factor SEC2